MTQVEIDTLPLEILLGRKVLQLCDKTVTPSGTRTCGLHFAILGAQQGGTNAMPSLWKLGGLSWLQLAKRVWREIQEDNVFGRAAELSYYFLLALFPFLIFLTSIIGLVLGSGTGMRHTFFNYLARIMPPSAFQLIDSTMYEVSAASSGGKLSFGFLAALWAASNGLTAITDSLNTAYDLKESRPWWKTRLVSIV